MNSIPISRAKLDDIFNSVVESRQPVRLTSHNSSAVLVGWEEWQAIEETLYRLSAPALRSLPRARRVQGGEQAHA